MNKMCILYHSPLPSNWSPLDMSTFCHLKNREIYYLNHQDHARWEQILLPQNSVRIYSRKILIFQLYIKISFSCPLVLIMLPLCDRSRISVNVYLPDLSAFFDKILPVYDLHFHFHIYSIQQFASYRLFYSRQVNNISCSFNLYFLQIFRYCFTSLRLSYNIWNSRK